MENVNETQEFQTQKAVVIKDVSFFYEENQPCVINNFSLEIEAGEFLAVVGRNGSGKSTLAKLINGLISPKTGSITVFGKPTVGGAKGDLFEIRKSCGIVFQNPDNQMVATFVEDDVAFGPENIGVSREEIGERIDFALKATGTEQFRKSSATRLSGGQKQRVAIAGVLALKPKILILDESTSMLDPKGREEVMNVVKRLNKEEKMTVIVITHYMDETVDCDKIAVVSNGTLASVGTPSEIFAKPQILYSAGLDLPLPLKISKMLKGKGVDVGDNMNKETLAKKLCELFQKI